MTVKAPSYPPSPIWLGALFDRILCGIDGTESSRAAAIQADRLLAARRVLDVVSVVETPAKDVGTDDPDLARQHETARRALREGHRLCPRARTHLLSGEPGVRLASAAQEAQATLVVIGAPASGRLGHDVLGTVGTHLLHEAPCSVLIARPPRDETVFPHSIVVGHDGSRLASAAADVAKELAHRFDADLKLLVATGDEQVDVDGLSREDELEWCSLPPVEALEAASADADLIVVGSSGLRGSRPLGTVSERISHLARCSVLVVREPHGQVAVDRDGRDDAVPDDEC
jgi:nucleotide-binding universal stress UspA family protein